MASVNLPGLSVHYAETGVNLYGICRRLSDGKVRDVVAGAWDTFAVADIDDYDTACDEADTGAYLYIPVMPDGVTDVGEYVIHVYRRAGASPAIGDLHVADVFVSWGGLGLLNGLPTARASGYGPDATVVVADAATAAARGTALVAAYTAAKALTPGGSALSASNRAVVLIPPGFYDLSGLQASGGMLVLDGEYVDLQGLESDNPRAAVVYSDGISDQDMATIEQTADDVRLTGFTLANKGVSVVTYDNCAFMVNASDNSASRYADMHFRDTSGLAEAGVHNACPVWSEQGLAGLWENCEADPFAWRVQKDQAFTAEMYDCHVRSADGSPGQAGFVGGDTGVTLSGRFVRCTAGIGSFGGGTGHPSAISGTLIDCEAGDGSYARGMEFSGTAIRCRGGATCFAGYLAGNVSTFSGYAEDCIATGDSFGAGHSTCKNSGRLVRCCVTGMAGSMYATGALIEGCLITTDGSNAHCLVLNDSNTEVADSTLLANGTGKSIYAATALNVVAIACRSNADLGANVTNTSVVTGLSEQLDTLTGPGAVTDTFTATYSGSPVEGAEIWVTASSATTPVIEGTYTTNALGQATFHLDVANGYYVHVQKTGYTFTGYPKEFNVEAGGFAWA